MKLTLFLILGLALIGCSRESAEPLVNSPEAKYSLPGEEHVLVRVDSTTLSEYDLEYFLNSVLGYEQTALLGDQGYQQALESLVATRAISLKAIDEMSAQDKLRLDKKTEAYREQLLVKAYLRQHAEPLPVTQEMIENYYNKYPEQFGGGLIREYELISVEGNVVGHIRSQVIEELTNLMIADDWPQAVASKGQAEYSLYYRSSKVDNEILEPQLLNLIDSLELDEVSKPTFIKGRPYIVRVNNEYRNTPRALNLVSAQIRKSLAPVQLKKAIQVVKTKALESAEVEYLSVAIE